MVRTGLLLLSLVLLVDNRNSRRAPLIVVVVLVVVVGCAARRLCPSHNVQARGDNMIDPVAVAASRSSSLR